MIDSPENTTAASRTIGPSIGATQAACTSVFIAPNDSGSSGGRLIFLQLIQKCLRGGAGVVEALCRDLTNELEMKAVFERASQ